MDGGWTGSDGFNARVGAYLEGCGPADAVFEPYEDAQARVVACVREIVAGMPPAQAVAVVSHGRILTVLFSALCGVRLGHQDWRRIGMPDCSVVDLAAGRVESGFFADRDIDARLISP